MNSSTKITLSSQTGTGSKYAYQKVPIIMRAIFKLALVNAYDEEGRIRNSKGEYVPNTNLVDLLVLAMTPKKDIYGIDEFVERLAEAKADPNWFQNEHVSRLLSEKLINVPRLQETAPVRPTTLNPVSSGAYWGPEKAKQRKLASFTRPPKAKPVSYTPPTSPPSPFKKNFADNFSTEEMPIIERMNVPPASPPIEMPTLQKIIPSNETFIKQKRARSDDSEDEDELPDPKYQRVDDNKSDDWIAPPPDDSDDDW